MTSPDDPEWVEEKLFGEIPPIRHHCNFCKVKSSNLLKINLHIQVLHSCAEAYNSWLHQLYYPEPVPLGLLQEEDSYPCYQSLEEPF